MILPRSAHFLSFGKCVIGLVCVTSDQTIATISELVFLNKFRSYAVTPSFLAYLKRLDQAVVVNEPISIDITARGLLSGFSLISYFGLSSRTS